LYLHQELASINGRISLLSEAQIPATDRGLLYGDGVFETLLCLHGKTLDADAHLERLRASATMVQLELPWSDAELKFEINSLAEASQMEKAAVRLIVTRGCGFGLTTKPGTPNRYIYLTKATFDHPRGGLSLKLLHQNYTVRESAAKVNNYLSSIVAFQALGSNYDEILWLNSEGELTEAATANIFLIARHGDLIEIATPAVTSGILLGITRQKIINLLSEMQILVEEKVIYGDELPRFDEAFLTSTVRGLIPIKSIGKHKLHTCKDNSLFYYIQKAYLNALNPKNAPKASGQHTNKLH
jgi:branched-chain amino acid aminotransferase